MEILNFTPFPSISWENVDAEKHWYHTCLTRVRYKIKPPEDGGIEWGLKLDPEQGELFAADVFYGEDVERPTRYESDLITHKQNTDVVINANTYSPSGGAQISWACGAKVFNEKGALLKSIKLSVCGTHWWKPGFMWRKSSVEPVRKVRLSYDNADGGRVRKTDAEGDVPEYWIIEESNPVGTGVKHKKMPAEPFPAPQVGWQQQPTRNVNYPPGMGFINRCWKIRRAYSGTYDQQWLDEQHPYPPKDFDDFHQQAANPELILSGFLQPNSEIELENLFPFAPKARLRIPELYCFAELTDSYEQLQRHKLNIDTLLIDIESEDPDQWSVYVSYRKRVPVLHTFSQCQFHYLPSEWIDSQSRQGVSSNRISEYGE